MAQAQAKPVVSFLQFAQGGLIDDIDVTFADCQFCEYDYNGTQAATLALAVQMVDAEGKEYDQFYSAGDLKYFVPSDDGAYPVPVGDKVMLNDSTNVSKFFVSLLQAGLPEEILASGDVHKLIGLKCHVNRVAQPKRSGLLRGGDDTKEKTVLLVTAIHELPGEAGKTAGKTAAKPAAGKAAAAGNAAPKPGTPVGKKPNGAAATTTAAPAQAALTGSDDETAEAAAGIITEILAEADGNSLAKKDMISKAFASMNEKVKAGDMDSKAKTKVTQLVAKDSFLATLVEAGTITYDGATVSLA